MQTDIDIEVPVSMSMAPYTGTWTRAEAAHLLRRTLVGPSFQQITDAVSNGMNATVASLLTINSVNPPLTYDPQEGVAAIGTTWVNSVYPSGDTQPTEDARRNSLQAWLMERLNSSDLSIAEKMTLFWQNHFAVETAFDSRASYDYFMLLRNNCLGNFKQLVKEVTVNPAMLLFLNGSSNTLYSPNENYARELLELFSIGKGPQIGPGDYTNYKEEDIAAGARILTGWRVTGLRSSTEASVQAVFDPTLHDNTDKILSSHFGGVTVEGNVQNEYIDYIDVIFQQDACAEFICTKLYRYFVNYDLTTEVETDVIPVMKQTLLDNNYNVLPVMEELLKSEHFYDVSLRGSQIKSPIESFFTWFNSATSSPSYTLETNYKMYLNLYWATGLLGQSYGAPPSVGGWPAYYQTPSFSQLWLNASYLKLRFDYAAYLTIYGGITVDNESYKVNALNVVDGLSVPNQAVPVIDDLCDLYFCKPIDQADKTALKSILTNGLPDFEWTIQYDDYQNNPGDATYSDPVKARVELVLAQIFRMAQFQTI